MGAVAHGRPVRKIGFAVRGRRAVRLPEGVERAGDGVVEADVEPGDGGVTGLGPDGSVLEEGVDSGGKEPGPLGVAVAIVALGRNADVEAEGSVDVQVLLGPSECDVEEARRSSSISRRVLVAMSEGKLPSEAWMRCTARDSAPLAE